MAITFSKKIPLSLKNKLTNVLIAGAHESFTPNEAFLLGAFVEDAIDENEAIDSELDVFELFQANDELMDEKR